MEFPDNLTDAEKIKIMHDVKGKRAEQEKEAKLEKEFSVWKFLPILPVLFLILWKFVPLPDPNYRNPTADDILSGLSGYHVSPGSDGKRPVVPLRQRPFDPTKYEQKVAKCKAKERGTGWLFAKDKEVEIEIHYVDINPTAEKTLLLVHGWPAVWSSWRNQILEFEDTHRLIIPTLRGFGNSTSPGDTEGSSGLPDFGNDLVCVLEDAKVDGAVCVGHDWGSAICFDTALEHPSKITALANAAVPYLPPKPFFFTPSQVASRYPPLSYQVYLTNDRHLAASELDARPKDLVVGLLAEVGMENPPPTNPLSNTKTILGAWGDQPIADQKLVSKPEEDYWVDAFKTSGFESTIAIYQVKNRKRSVDVASRRKTHAINVPTLYISPTEDALGNLRFLFGDMIEKIPNLEIKDMATNHWPQLEKPEEYNAYLKEFLELL